MHEPSSQNPYHPPATLTSIPKQELASNRKPRFVAKTWSELAYWGFKQGASFSASIVGSITGACFLIAVVVCAIRMATTNRPLSLSIPPLELSLAFGALLFFIGIVSVVGGLICAAIVLLLAISPLGTQSRKRQ